MIFFLFLNGKKSLISINSAYVSVGVGVLVYFLILFYSILSERAIPQIFHNFSVNFFARIQTKSFVVV